MIVRTRRSAFLLFCCVVYPMVALSQDDWAQKAHKDLEAIKLNLIKHSAPYVCQDVAFHRWLEEGYEAERAQSVDSFESYRAVLEAYVHGFHDTHLYVRPVGGRKGMTKKARPKGRLGSPSASFAIRCARGGAWIRIPTFQPDVRNAQVFRDILKQLRSLRHKRWILFDVRGNGGGSTDWERPILRNLFGDPYLKGLGPSFDYNQVWRKGLRVSHENIAFMEKSGMPKGEFKAFQQALEEGKGLYEINWSIYDEPSVCLFSHQDKAPVTARIFILTDGGTGSTAWLFVREMRQISGVTQIGLPTQIQSLYSETRPVTLPSGLFNLLVPMQVRLNPIQHIGQPFVPSEIYPLALTSEKDVRALTFKLIDHVCTTGELGAKKRF